VSGTRWRYETTLMIVLCLMFGVVFFDRNAMAYLAPFVAKDLGLSNTQIGMLASALSLTWALSAFGVSAYSDATGRRKSVLLACIVVFSLSSIGGGLAASFAVLLSTRLLMGLSEGGILPISQSLLAVESSHARRGLNMGVMQNFGSNLLGSFAAPLILVAVANAWHWRAAFFVAAVPGLLCALLVARYVREPARGAIPPAGARSRATEVSAADRAPAGSPAPADSISASELFRERNMWICVLVCCVMVAWMVLGWTFLPVYYMNARGISSGSMSVLMSLLGISAAVFSFIVPGLSDRLGRKPMVIVFCAVGVLVPLAALYYQGPLGVLGALIFLGWAASGTFPIFMATIPSETISVRHVATATGTVVGIGEITGGVLSPTLAGRAADVYGLHAPLLIMTACAIVGAVLALFLVETAPARTTRAEPLRATREPDGGSGTTLDVS
jgi:MFS family permease